MIREPRLGRKLDREAAAYTSSVEFDRELFEYEALASMAHAVMLYEQGLLRREEARGILEALRALQREGVNALRLEPEMEDIHLAVEEYVSLKAGEAGEKLHTARSRNDQVACELRMKARDALIQLCKALLGAVSSLLRVAERNVLTVMPAYTHLQHAQPTTLAHHLLGYADALLRCFDRLADAYRRTDLSPLGACACAATSFPINRERTAQLLGFSGLLENSMDAVSSRDYMLEIAADAAMLSTELSRLAQELILWSTEEFSFIEIEDRFAFTSSIMPQKKNPDVLEIMRARTGVSLGSLMSMLAITRALPQSYNRDLQELSPIFFSELQRIAAALTMLSKMLVGMKVNGERMAELCARDFSTATELADLLVREKAMPFRKAHQITALAVAKAVRKGLEPGGITAELLADAARELYGMELSLSPEAVADALKPLSTVKARKVKGGPAPEAVRKELEERLRRLAERERIVRGWERRLRSSRERLIKAVDAIVGG